MQLEFQRAYLGHKASVYILVEGPKEGQFVSGGGEGWITLWELDKEDGNLLAQAGSTVLSLSWLEPGLKLAAGTLDGKLHFIDLENKDMTRVFELGGKASLFDIVKKDNLLWVADGTGRISWWDVNGELAGSVQISKKPLRKLLFVSPGTLLIGGSEGRIFEFDVTGKTVKKDWHAHDPSVFSMARIQGDERIWSGGRDALIREWDISTELPVCTKEVNAHWFTVNNIAFHPSERIFATASRDKRLRLWDSDAGLLQSIDPGTRNGHVNSVNTLLWADSGNYLISAGDDRSIRSWKLIS